MKFAIAILAALALLLAGCASSAPQEQPAPQAPLAPTVQTPPADAPPPSDAPPAPPEVPVVPEPMAPPATITAADVALHNTETDCWVSYQGTVYDITQFLPKHKSYQALLVPLCGKTDEFTQAFEGKHGMSKIDVLKSESVRVGDLTP